jgi:adenine phosphoribosyltransferase
MRAWLSLLSRNSSAAASSGCNSTDMNDLTDRLKAALVTYPDWPKPGVTFADLSPVYADPQLRSDLTRHFVEIAASNEIHTIAAIESRGYLLGMSLADELNLPFIQIRKSGKLPGDCFKVAYSLEYGTAEIEVQCSAFNKGARVMIVDDVLATGGTMKAATELIEQAGAVVLSVAVIAEIAFLNGRANIHDVEVSSLLNL